jgi:uncharacterized membrane protein YdjX (TVP38/TMEM64 family)
VDLQPLAAASHRRRQTAIKLLLVALVLAGAAAVLFSPLRDLSISEVRESVDRLARIWYGPVVFILMFAIGSVLFFPATLFILAAGLVWGWRLGAPYALLGATLGALGSFAIAKYVGGGVLARLGRRGEQVARKLDHAGFKTLLILRLIPLWPFPVFNYAAGLAGVRYRDFISSTVVGLCPAIFVMAYSADALVSGTLTGADAFRRLLTIALLVALVILVPSLFRKRAVRTLHLDEDLADPASPPPAA